MKRKCSVTMDGIGRYALRPVTELVDVLKDIPANTTYSLTFYEGDRPWESGSFSIEFSWTEDV